MINRCISSATCKTVTSRVTWAGLNEVGIFLMETKWFYQHTDVVGLTKNDAKVWIYQALALREWLMYWGIMELGYSWSLLMCGYMITPIYRNLSLSF